MKLSGFFNAGGGGGGGTNPTNGFMPVNDSGSFIDSAWYVSNGNTFTNTGLGAVNGFGLFSSFLSGSIKFGDFNGGTYLDYTAPYKFKTFVNSNFYGFYVDTNVTEIGNDTLKIIFNNNSATQIYGYYNNTTEIGLALIEDQNFIIGDSNNALGISQLLEIINNGAFETLVTKTNGYENGLNFQVNAVNQTYVFIFGDFINYNNYVQLNYNVSAGIDYFATIMDNNNYIGFYFDYANTSYNYGDNVTNSHYLNISSTRISSVLSNAFGFEITSDTVVLGDYSNLYNGSKLKLDDATQKLIFSNNLITNSPSGTGVSGYLHIFIDGLGLYYLELLS
jgi:hypothetical protein